MRRRVEKHDWQPRQLARLKALWLKGELTMLEIAAEISERGHPLSRSCVAGMIRRHGLIRKPTGPRRAKEEPPKKPKKPKRVKKPPEKPSPSPLPEVTSTVVPLDASSAQVKGFRVKNRVRRVRNAPADGKPVGLLDLGSGCKWPVDMRGHEHLFCNQPRSPSSESYCAYHVGVSRFGLPRGSVNVPGPDGRQVTGNGIA